MHPQLSYVGYFISICNLRVISCYANIRYNIMRSRFDLPYKVNPMSNSSQILDQV